MALKVLSALDSAKTQFYHFKAIIVAGMGLFTDAYDFFCISIILKLIGRIYYDSSDPDQNYQIKTSVLAVMVGTMFLGTAIGQITFGILGDRRGRRSVYGTALMVMVISSIASGFSICRTRNCVLTSLGVFRFCLGLGIGGDYPLSATIMSEFANKRTRGGFIAGVFSLQGFGILASAMVSMFVLKMFWISAEGLTEDHTPEDADIAWRLILMLGAVPAGLTYYFRMLMPETARYTALVENNVLQAAKDMEKVLDISMSQIAEDQILLQDRPSYPLLSKKFLCRHGRDLFSCSINWFLLDIVFYSSNLFQSQIYSQFLNIENANVYEESFKIAAFQAIVAISATIPGYYFTVFFIDRIGRRKIQILGFFAMSLVYFALGISYSHWRDKKNPGFLVLYGLTFFFANFGPNTTTFIVPAELFPARFRSTCHGIAGAVGKLGALVGSLGVLWATDEKDKIDESHIPKTKPMKITLVCLGLVCVLGMVLSYLYTPETMGRSLEDNEIDDDDDEED
ncbi:phosphate transporter 1 1 [Euphorbia peplus]|nr:phosphate transporter 1 1 [Euphorbia peplus]